jgi:hypothetical protein
MHFEDRCNGTDSHPRAQTRRSRPVTFQHVKQGAKPMQRPLRVVPYYDLQFFVGAI